MESPPSIGGWSRNPVLLPGEGNSTTSSCSLGASLGGWVPLGAILHGASSLEFCSTHGVYLLTMDSAY